MRSRKKTQMHAIKRQSVVISIAVGFVIGTLLFGMFRYAESQPNDEALIRAVHCEDIATLERSFQSGMSVDHQFHYVEGPGLIEGWILRIRHIGICSNRRSYEGLTPLMLTSGDSNPKMTQYLLSRGANPNFAKDDGWTALHVAALCGSDKSAEALLRNGAKVDLSDISGDTPLKVANRMKREKVIQILKAAGAKE